MPNISLESKIDGEYAYFSGPWNLGTIRLSIEELSVYAGEQGYKNPSKDDSDRCRSCGHTNKELDCDLMEMVFVKSHTRNLDMCEDCKNTVQTEIKEIASDNQTEVTLELL